MTASRLVMAAMVALSACAPAGPPPAPPRDAPAPALSAEQEARRDERYRDSLALVRDDLISAPLDRPAEPPTLLARRRLGQAIDGFREALAIDPAFWPAWWALGKSYERLGRPADAVPCLGAALARAPEGIRAPIARDLATNTAALGNADKTIDAYETATRLDPYDAGLVAQLAAAYLEAGHVSAARQVLMEGIRRHGDDVQLRRMLGKVDVVEAGDKKACVAKPGAPCPPGTAPPLPGTTPIIRTR